MMGDLELYGLAGAKRFRDLLIDKEGGRWNSIEQRCESETFVVLV